MRFVNLITLTTDFGLKDPYVGQLKGAILKRNITARIIDLTHFIPVHDILTAAITIRSSYGYFPRGTVHLIVVDPGVGSQRHILAIMADDHLFIAPDNGIVTLLARDGKIQAVHRIDNSSLFPREVSETFHGRDIMAPIAAALADGMPLQNVGPEIEIRNCVQLDLPVPQTDENGITGQVLYIDHFGNIRTTITTAYLGQFQPSSFSGIYIGKHRIHTISTTYSEQSSGELLALIDSSGYLEIAINKGNAAQKIDCRIGDPVSVIMNSEHDCDRDQKCSL